MKTLLVALDGSSFADAALPVAVGLAQQLRARLLLVSVLDRDPWRYATGGAPLPDHQLEREREGEWRTAVQRYLDGAKSRIARLADAPPVQTRVLTGPVSETLLACAHDNEVSMLVVTTHGRGGLSRAWLGSITESLLRNATLPIVAIRPTDDPASSPLLPQWTLRRILVALDGSVTAERVLVPLRALAEAGVECVLMRAVSPLHPMLRTVATGAEYERDLREQRALVSDYLQRTERLLRAQGLNVSCCVHEEFEPHRGINDCADSLNADLIALATRGKGPTARVLLGSVADKVVRTSTRPVLLVPVDDEEIPT